MSAETPSWRLAPHVCAVCFGRILARPDPDASEHGTLYRCSNCGAEKRSTRPESLCACGITLRTGRNAGIRCIPNPSRTPECPAEIVAEEIAAPGKSAPRDS